MPLDPALREKILASVEAGFAEQIAFTQELIRFASVRGAEHTCQDFVFRALRERGYAMDRFCDGPRGDRGSSRRQPLVGRAFRCADRRRHSSSARGEGPLADPAGPRRCRAARACRYVDP